MRAIGTHNDVEGTASGEWPLDLATMTSGTFCPVVEGGEFREDFGWEKGHLSRSHGACKNSMNARWAMLLVVMARSLIVRSAPLLRCRERTQNPVLSTRVAWLWLPPRRHNDIARAVCRRSWFVVRGSWFVVRGSWFVVRGSWFGSHYVEPVGRFIKAGARTNL